MPEPVDDPHRLKRFIDAQKNVYQDVLVELRAGRKTSHWIWFIFPQIAGLGHSPTAQHYAIQSLAEAKAYIAHPILGPRLRECTELVNSIEGASTKAGASIEAIMGYPDDLKFRSSMTLFAQATRDNEPFIAALEKYFKGQPDQQTLSRI